MRPSLVERLLWAPVITGLLLTVLGVGCEPRRSVETPSAEEPAAKLWVEGQGLKLPEETRQALGVQTARVEPQTIRPQLAATAQVFARQTNELGQVRALASAWLPASVPAPPHGSRGAVWSAEVTNLATVVRVDETPRGALGHVEVVLELEGALDHLAPGRFVEARLEAASLPAAVAVPSRAVVRAGLGDFVYVVEGEFFKRVAVQLGAEDSAWVEIRHGLAPGQTVVSQGAEALWLLELSEVGGMANLK